VKLEINGNQYEVDVENDVPLLWVLRDHLGLTGTKFGCGVGECGSCTVHMDGVAVRSCITPAFAVSAAGARITTIEGLGGDRAHAVQRAWIREQVPQCGYCQPGMIMTAASFLQQNPHPTDAQVDGGMINLCRCGTYPRIRRAIHSAARELADERARGDAG
jgi:aerobic-type carbon monoxide dehydrogenase small subunit (CoxS/CutS family)